MSIPKISNCYRQRFDRKARQFNRERPLVDYLIPLVKDGARILDIGSGPFSTIGTEGNIVLCDILADNYLAMMKRRGITPLISVDKQNMERLSYPDSSFDLVHCRNALDHTKNVRAALREMARVCKRHGRVYLRHYPNVGERNGYTGFHCWNLSIFKNRCKAWNHDEEFFISEILPGASARLERGMVVCDWTKD
jgi:SAM-dependent methyltransferase